MIYLMLLSTSPSSYSDFMNSSQNWAIGNFFENYESLRGGVSEKSENKIVGAILIPMGESKLILGYPSRDTEEVFFLASPCLRRS